MPERVETIEAFERLLKDPQNKGKAYVVPKNVFDYYVQKLAVQSITETERSELSEFLGSAVPESPVIGLTRPSKCPHCGHTFTFTDHFRAAMNAGVHSKQDLTKFTFGSDDDFRYLVIDTDATIEIQCVKCNKAFASPRCCYTTSSYAYV